MSLIKLLNNKIDRILFTTPSHNQKPRFDFNVNSFYKVDYSEIEGFDNLSNPKGEILMSMARASQLMRAKQTFFVTQGVTSAMLAAMKTIINQDDKVLVARNCHKSVYNGLILTNAFVDWFMPDTIDEWGIYGVIDPKKLENTLKINNYRAFIMTSPTYEGINSDIKEISKICKNYGVYLIVDEAHGALYNFSDNLPQSAMAQGADISVISLHKTAGALNQTALLNVSYDINNIEINQFQQSLNLFQTTSPSYPLLLNIEMCLNYLSGKDGKKDIQNLINDIENFKKDLKRFGVDVYEADNHDITKILVKKEGISGLDLSDFLYRDFNIEDELNNQISCLYLTGIGTSRQKLDKLKNALKKVITNESYEEEKIEFQPMPIVKIRPSDAFNHNFIYVNKQDCLLKISNTLVLPYPPGIGVLYPGEAIQKWHLDYLNNDVEVIV